VTGHPMDIMKSMLGGGLAYSFGGIAGGSIFPTRSSPAADLADADAVPATSPAAGLEDEDADAVPATNLAGMRVSAAQGQSAPGGGLGAS
ncbi:MAG: hypothetical protein AB8U48_03775, partial [Anaplasma ovis]